MCETLPMSSSYLYNATCSLSAKGDGINMNAFLVAEWRENIAINVTIYKKEKDGTRTLYFKIPSLILCEVFQNKYSITIVSMFSELVMKYSNFPEKCPIPKGSYFIKNMKLNGDSFPSVLPDINMIADAIMYDKKNQKPITSSTIHISVRNLRNKIRKW